MSEILSRYFMTWVKTWTKAAWQLTRTELDKTTISEVMQGISYFNCTPWQSFPLTLMSSWTWYKNEVMPQTNQNLSKASVTLKRVGGIRCHLEQVSCQPLAKAVFTPKLVSLTQVSRFITMYVVKWWHLFHLFQTTHVSSACHHFTTYIVVKRDTCVNDTSFGVNTA